MRNVLFLLTIVLALAGCSTSRAMRVGSYNVRLSTGDKGTPNAWDERKADLVALVRRLDLDVFGMQEVKPDQAQYFRENLSEWEFVGDHRGADRRSDEASPVFFRKTRFEALDKGTFWLSETPDVPASKSWGTACTRVCSYLILRDRRTGQKFCFANTHTDHVSELARKNGMELIIARMKKFGSGCPIVFTGDHNCSRDEAPAVAMRKVLKDARDVAEVRDSGPLNTFQGFGKHVGLDAASAQKLRIDYIYVSDGVIVHDFMTHGDKRPGGGLYPSDHYPVTATIELR